MNKIAIKNFAIWARNKLIADISYRAGLMGITAAGIHAALPQSSGQTEFYDIGTAEPYSITGKAVYQRRHLAELIRRKEKDTDYKTAYKYIIEEVAYTWFNRLIAVRFMEVNDYLPSHIRVLSSDTGKLEPDLVTTPFDADLEFTMDEQQTVLNLKNDNKLDEVFRFLFIKQCNALNEILPALFEKTNDYSELLLNVSVIDQDGVVYHLVHDIPEEDFDVERGGQVEIIGWLYQYYNTEPKNEAFAKKGKITKEEIPAVTQLFTPDWIVRYMVENSLGRLWVEGHPNDDLKAGWKDYLEEAEQEPEVQAQLDEIRTEYAKLNPEDIKIIDPCMGSGHILIYVFDVLMQIYESAGYGQRDAAKSILENNLYGLDIDDRAFQLAYFAVMMKARQYNRRILNNDCKPNLYAIQESNGIKRNQFRFFGGDLDESGKERAITQMTDLLDTFIDAKEYGSILAVDQYDWDLLDRFVSNMETIVQLSFDAVGLDETARQMKQIISQGQILAKKYHVATTNPPYMRGSGMSNLLSNYTKKYYPDSKNDLFAVFIEKCDRLLIEKGYQAMITQQSWMFLSGYEKLREKMRIKNTVSLLHLGAHAFEEIGGEVVQTTTFIIANTNIRHRVGKYVRLIGPASQQGKEEMFLAKSNTYFANNDTFASVPGKRIVYWLGSDSLWQHDKISKTFISGGRNKTHNNEKYVREWWEVIPSSKWILYMNGGNYRKWYGNLQEVVEWTEAAKREYALHGGLVDKRNSDSYGISWNGICGDLYGFRLKPAGIPYSSSSPTIVSHSHTEPYTILGFLNTVVSHSILSALNPTLQLNVGEVLDSPIELPEDCSTIDLLSKKCVDAAKEEWNCYETAKDFDLHPLVRESFKRSHSNVDSITIEECYRAWSDECESRFELIKDSEEELNRIFIDVYGLQDELVPEVDDKDVTVRRADFQRDIKSLLSYAVGCMFGRYSLDITGLVYAGDDWDEKKYSQFIPDDDNVIPISNEEYLEDDIVSRLCTFLKVVFGERSLEKNLDYIAKAVGKKGDSSREIIRNYFLTDFFREHCKTYSVSGSGKRPIYWLFDSGKQNGFKALIYLHRYNADTIGNIRIDYLHRMQRIYESEIGRMQDMIDHSTNAREVGKATKRRDKLSKQLKECREYDEKLAHLALSRIELDLDDGVKVNYRKLQTANDGKFYEVLADSKNIMAKK